MALVNRFVKRPLAAPVTDSSLMDLSPVWYAREPVGIVWFAVQGMGWFVVQGTVRSMVQGTAWIRKEVIIRLAQSRDNHSIQHLNVVREDAQRRYRRRRTLDEREMPSKQNLVRYSIQLRV